METPLKISFQGGDTSDALRQLVVEHVDSLEQLYGRLTACHIAIKVPDKHHRTSGLFSAKIHMTLPGGIDINVDHTPQVHIPTKPAGYPEVMSATHSNLIAATVPISSRPGDAVSSGRFW